MDSSKYVLRTFTKINSHTIYTVVLIALVLTGLTAFLPKPFNNSSTAAAAEDDPVLITATRTARADELSIALDLRSAHDLAVFGSAGVKGQDGSSFRGQVATEAVQESAKGDLERTLAIINQLPCTELADGNLAGKAFGPGVFCLPSMSLAGRMTLNAGGDPNALFVFVVKGSLNADSTGNFAFENGARASNVYFAVNDAASVAPGVKFGGNIISEKTLSIGAGADIDGRAFSTKGEVIMENANVGGGTGILEICKQQQGTGLENRIFRFRIGAQIVQTPVGSCTGPIDLATGNVVIEELTDGPLIGGGTWNGRFRLVDVNSPTPGALGAVNLAQRTANVFIREGDVNNLTVVNFVNTFAITATVEICKRAASGAVDVSGFFDFTIDSIPNTVFSVPAGFCSGAITVTVRTPSQPTPPPPGVGALLVTELAEPGFQLEAVSTFPADRLQNTIFNSGVVNTPACSNIGTDPIPPACIFSNPGGGIADVQVLEGGVANQTTVNFFNRSRPGQLKVCKVAGPGIPIGTVFRFRVQGTGPSNPFPGTQLPGVAVDTTVDVPAGPADQGGFCNFVNASFIIGTPVTVTELLPTVTPVPGVPPGEIRVSRIRSSQAPISMSLAARTVTLTARRETIETEFTNFVFRPTLLKICKIAGPGVAVGTPFTFSIRIDDEGGLFSPPSTIAVPNLTVQAGPASQGGFCQFAQGPYTPTATTPPVGTFRVGSRVFVTEAAAPGTVLDPVTSPTGTVTACTPADPRCASLTLSNPDAFNELVFTNRAAPAPVPTEAAVRFDFDGDRKSDISIFRPSTGTWWWAASSANGAHRATNWGLANDKLVAADYDGDGKTDMAIYRDGGWYILGSTDGVRIQQFGLAGDIPQTGDYDGDGKADLAVFRPSDRTWYILQSRDGFTAGVFGLPSDKPVAADYDGDGKTDLAVYRDGTWYVLRSRDGFTAYQWGLASDTPLPADFDGDDRADATVYRNGTWYILKSTGGHQISILGTATDRPVPADYDGDGKTDTAIFRPSENTWYIVNSSLAENTTTVLFGADGDRPVPGE